MEGNDEKHLEYLKAAIEENPNLASPHHWLSVWYNENGRFQESIEEIEKAVSLDPKSPIILCAAAWAYQRIGNDNKQKELILKTSEVMPGFQSVEMFIGDIYQEQYQWEKAEKYNNSFDKHPEYTDNIDNKFNLFGYKFYHYLITNQYQHANNIVKAFRKVWENIHLLK